MAAAFLAAPLPKKWQASAHQFPCGITQITDSAGTNTDPAISGDGRRVAFISVNDLTGGNPDHGPELFLYDTATSGLIQISNLPAARFVFLTAPSINGDGTRIVFGTTVIADPPGATDFLLYDVQTGTLTQISHSTGSFDAPSGSISGDGKRIAFVSNANLTGGNPDQRFQMFLYDVQIGSLTQISDFTEGVAPSRPSISNDGTRIALVSSDFQIYLLNTQTALLTQITDSSGESIANNPSISGNGTHIAFQFQRFVGDSSQIYLYETATANFTQVTYSTEMFFSGPPSINGDGSRIAFASNLDLTRGNPDHNFNIFIYDKSSRGFTQVTNSGNASASSGPAITGNGTRVAFSTTGDLTGGNPDHNPEIFVASCERLAGGNTPIRVYPLAVYTEMLPEFAADLWFDPASGNSVRFDTYGKLNRLFELGLNTSVTGNVTVRDLRDGNQEVVVDVRTIEGICSGFNKDNQTAFGYNDLELDSGIGPAAVGRGTLRVTFEPQPVGPIRADWPIQSVITNITCEGVLRAGSGYPEGTPGIAQTTQTGLYNTGVPGGCPREHDADCFPAEKVQFKAKGK